MAPPPGIAVPPALVVVSTVPGLISVLTAGSTPAPSAPPLAAGGGALPSFEAFLERFNKSYEPLELDRRRAFYEEALREIAAVNARRGGLWTAGVNRFADASPEERLRRRSAVGRSRVRETSMSALSLSMGGSGALLPRSIDWRHVSGKIRDEGQCGACFAIAASSALESHIFLATGTRVDVSEQAVTDCTYPTGDSCGTGGTLQDAFAGAVRRGVADAASYPWTSGHTGQQGRCKLGAGVDPVAGITDFVEVEANNPSALMQALATAGPVAVGVDASKHWDFYSGGILDTCDKHHVGMDHDVLLVGYGEENGVEYWLAQNGWNSDWGEGGYIRLRREARPRCAQDSSEKTVVDCGVCGVLSDPVYPTGGYLRRHHHHHHGSCASYGCVGYMPSHSCQCNSKCARHGNCCSDYWGRCHHRRLVEGTGPVLV